MVESQSQTLLWVLPVVHFRAVRTNPGRKANGGLVEGPCSVRLVEKHAGGAAAIGRCAEGSLRYALRNLYTLEDAARWLSDPQYPTISICPPRPPSSNQKAAAWCSMVSGRSHELFPLMG